MSELLTIRIQKVATELNIGWQHIVEHLKKKGLTVENKPTAKITEEMYQVLLRDFQLDKATKQKAEQITLGVGHKDQLEIEKDKITPPKKGFQHEEILIKGSGTITEKPKVKAPEEKEIQKIERPKPVPLSGPTVVGKVDLEGMNQKTRPDRKEKKPKESPVVSDENIKITTPQEQLTSRKKSLEGLTVKGKIDINQPTTEGSSFSRPKRKRKKLFKDKPLTEAPKRFERGPERRSQETIRREPTEITKKEVEDKLKQTLARLDTSKGKSAKSKYRRMKREAIAEEEQQLSNLETKKKLQVTEFISVSELANMMNVPYSDVIKACMNLGIIVSINQRLDAELIEMVASEFGNEVQFVDVKEQDEILKDEIDSPEKLKPRAPIVTIMGHVDHGKTSLLDYLRSANVVAGEVGGITQHIGAYEVTLPNKKNITFLDTPGHEAFTAMRARGAKITDVAVIVIAADDSVMPQTREAISHAQAAGVPMIFAINKIDKPGANSQKIKEQLSQMNILLEDWGGKYQSQEISAKKGTGIDLLLEKILLEAELLELKANPDKNAVGTVIEATLDRGRGYVSTILIQSGTLNVGDIVLSGANYGKVKAMYNERGNSKDKAGPASPVLILGLNGAPQAGEIFKVYDSEQEVKQLANKRLQIMREQGLRTKKHITLDEIGRRLALGNFKQLNIIIKGDVDGSIEALGDSLLKLSTDEIKVNIVHKAVGQITESDVLLASASDAIIIGFQVRPSLSARKLAEKENIEIRLYSIIYDAIEELKSAMEGMLEPKIEEKIVCNIEVREVFKITKVGAVAGCLVTDGKITRNTKVRIVREGIVIYSGELASLKRFKDDVREVLPGIECGLSIKNFNDIKVGDIVEGYEQVEVKRTL